jgi:hypothetical protein
MQLADELNEFDWAIALTTLLDLLSGVGGGDYYIQLSVYTIYQLCYNYYNN